MKKGVATVKKNIVQKFIEGKTFFKIFLTQGVYWSYISYKAL